MIPYKDIWNENELKICVYNYFKYSYTYLCRNFYTKIEEL